MKVRGERECTDCGTRWSYYETGRVECPDCGSIVSVGVDERTRHTASAESLDLTTARELVESEQPLRRAAERAVDLCTEFVRGYGFIHAGTLQDLDETYLAAMELRHVAGRLARRMRVGDDEEYYFLDLLRGADRGERPARETVPTSLRGARGLAYATAVREYRADLRDYLEDHPDPPARGRLEALDEHSKRVRALDGDVPPETAERLVEAARDLGSYLRGEEAALARAEDRLDRLWD